MTDRQQSAFFLAIVFLFTSGIGLVIYREYDQYYQQKVATDLEVASATEVPAENLSASTTTPSINGWKTYKNNEYGFEFEYPPSPHQLDAQSGSIYLGGNANVSIFILPTDSSLKYSSVPTVINGYNAWEIKGSGTLNHYFIQDYFERGNFTVELEFSDNNKSPYIQVFRKMLSTIKFTK